MNDDTMKLAGALNVARFKATQNPALEPYSVETAISNLREVFSKTKLRLGTIEIRRRVDPGRDQYQIQAGRLILGDVVMGELGANGAAFPVPGEMDWLTCCYVDCTLDTSDETNKRTEVYDLFIAASSLKILYMRPGFGGGLHNWVSGLVVNSVLDGVKPYRLTEPDGDNWDVYTYDVSKVLGSMELDAGYVTALIRIIPPLWVPLTSYYEETITAITTPPKLLS